MRFRASDISFRCHADFAMMPKFFISTSHVGRAAQAAFRRVEEENAADRALLQAYRAASFTSD